MTIRIDGTNTAANPGITGSDTDTGLQFGTDEVNVLTAGTSRVTVDSNGNVGIGTTSPGTDPAVGNNATILEVRQTTSGSLTAGNSRKGAVLRLTHDAQWENPYGGGDDLGSIEFSTTDTSTGEGVRARIRCTNNVYYQDQDLVFDVAGAASATINERLRILNEGGITFNGDTAAANALDDYEEGTWTPTILGTTTDPTVSYTQQVGEYIKIGNKVTVWLYLLLASASGGAGNINIGGLPYNNSGDTGKAEGATLAINYYGNTGFSTGQVPSGYGRRNDDKIYFVKLGTGTNSTSVAVSSLGANWNIYGCMTYYLD